MKSSTEFVACWVQSSYYVLTVIFDNDDIIKSVKACKNECVKQRLVNASNYINQFIVASRMKLKLYIFASKVELDCNDGLNPEELAPYFNVLSYFKQDDALHVRISGLKTSLSIAKNSLAPKNNRI